MANIPAWRCPYCGQFQRNSDKNTHYIKQKLDLGEPSIGECGLLVSAVRCLNEECNQLTLGASLTLGRFIPVSGWNIQATVQTWMLQPESAAKTQPVFIPEPLRADYYEACLIRDKSPKAAATLARRCLQGMIRDFCGITKPTLFKEIEELRKRVDEDRAPKGVEHETMDAIDAVREIGNIGAHMEKDINLIVEVDPGEAQALIELIEMLFEDWYVARHDREARLARIKGIAADKKAEKLAKPEEPLQIEAVDVAQIADQSDAD